MKKIALPILTICWSWRKATCLISSTGGRQHLESSDHVVVVVEELEVLIRRQVLLGPGAHGQVRHPLAQRVGQHLRDVAARVVLAVA